MKPITKENMIFEEKCIIKYGNMLDKVQTALIKRIIESLPELSKYKEVMTKLVRKTNFKKELNVYPFVTEYKKIEFEDGKKYYYNNVGTTVNDKGIFVGFVIFSNNNYSVNNVTLLEDIDEIDKLIKKTDLILQ